MKIHEYFTWIDWTVLFGYLLLTTLIGHRLRGKQGTIRDFFLGGRTLPWLAVSGSIVATELSGVTFIGVPGGVLAADGNFTYLLWALGTIIGRALVAAYFVPAYFQADIYSPYDYMGKRVGVSLKKLATAFFTVGSILAQSVRVLVAALPLKVVTGMDFRICILAIGAFAIAWTLMGGMRTVIWTDVVQFGLFVFGGLLALFWLSSQIDGGWSHVVEVAGEAGKTQVWDGRFGFGPEFEFTFWVAILAVPFLNLSAFGVDQLNAQRMFCCRDVKDARKALVVSCLGQLVTLLMLAVGAALFVYYREHPPTGPVADYLQFDEAGVPSGIDGSDAVFPTWIVTQLPPGLSGLILAGVFAAAISSLDSILAALSQTTMSVVYPPESHKSDADVRKALWLSKGLVVFWGVALAGFTLLMYQLYREKGIPILPLAFRMTAYTAGPMLGFFLGSLSGRASFRGLLIGSLASIVLVVFCRPEFWMLLGGGDGLKAMLAELPTLALDADGNLEPTLGFAWLWPITTALTLGCGLAFGGKGKGKGKGDGNGVGDAPGDDGDVGSAGDTGSVPGATAG